MATKQYRKVSTGQGAEFVQWKKGKIVEGIVQGFRPYKYKRKDHNCMEVADEKTGELIGITDHAALKNLLATAKKGNAVRIECTGQKKIKGQARAMWTFDVGISDA